MTTNDIVILSIFCVLILGLIYSQYKEMVFKYNEKEKLKNNQKNND